MEKDVIERLASYEHDRWSRWQKHVFSKCILNKDGSYTIPKEYVDKWTRQINTSYIDLTEEEKQKDRDEAIRIIKSIEEK